MDHFKYRNGALAAEDVLISKIAAEVGENLSDEEIKEMLEEAERA